MKITDISTDFYRWPLSKPIINGLHTATHGGVGFTIIETDAGITGFGLSGANPLTRAGIEHLAPMLIGQDPLDVERLWHQMWVPKIVGRRGKTTQAISAIDIGLWDIRGKAAGMPLYKLLGGYRDRVPTYIAGGYYQDGKGLDGLAQEMLDNVAMGATAIKIKIGRVSIREDVERVKVVREAVGPDVKLMIDANCAYRYYEAIQLAKKVEQFDPFWFEEPVAPDDLEGHSKLARATTIPIAAGENEYTRYGFRDLIAQGAVSIFNTDATVVGGVTEFMKVVALTQAHNLDMAPHGPQEIHVHLVAAIANGIFLEYYRDTVNSMWGEVYKTTLTLNEDGTVSPPNTPGIGVEPNYEALAPHRVR